MQRQGPSVESGLHDALLPADLRGRQSSAPACHVSSPAAPATAADGPGQKWWAHELSCSSIASSEGGYTQQPWLPDEVSAHCMLCGKPFHFWRWTHHCRDCGGLYCDACSTHRVEASGHGGSVQVNALRLCDTCAFSPSHPQHLGCSSPCACPRCTWPRSVGQLSYYAKNLFWDVVCFPFCCFGWSYVAQACAASTDARLKKLETKKTSQPSGLQPYLGPASQPSDARPLPQRICTAAPRSVSGKVPGGPRVGYEVTPAGAQPHK